ncbi:MAG: aminotransferase class V-fold PLP-dependent enzyme [Hamadaea sp.]|uniref:DegT/DnrJ/EryC1/StrS family aminotransferase n=1 Tax=Hamadaea sp. TaxID=2024425 RepID=UPI0017C2A584|nr:aminotransferase class V-fold PLP-dependent enzyme [Hamadaea sp.]NUR73461.1 aminotransferase class V-fold PLP-dependent enzyme [Hamadaea sp.]NUT24240.1 aminotransferase class V-fold PLP-dependent enzyme [Hamadaea sp.]
MLPYGKQTIEDSDIAAVTEALRSDWLTTGPQVDAFERDLAEWTGGVPVTVVSNGTAALHVAYAAAGIKAGDEVVTTPMTFVATASCATILGAEVVFADVEEDTANLDPAAAAAVTTERTKVIAAVDYAGHPAEYDELRKVADEVGALVLADAAHAIGGTYKGRFVGSLADLTTFSFFPTKNLTTAEGGGVASPDSELMKRARRFKGIGMIREEADFANPTDGGWYYEVQEFGVNYRLPDVLCALGRAQLTRLGAFKARRTALRARYNELLADVPGLRLPVERDWVDPAYHLYPVRVLDGRRREVYDKLRAAGIGVQVNYIPVYWHPAYAELGYRRGMCPNAEKFYAEELSLPLFPTLTENDQDRVVEALRTILG